MEVKTLMGELMHYALFIAKGAGITFELLIGGLSIGLVLGISFAILHYQKLGQAVINQFIAVIRGTPLILQLSFIYFSIPQLTHLKLNVIAAGVLAFGLNSAAYICEILRGGIESLARGQFEAAKSLHIPRFYMWKDIIFPQVLYRIQPALTNEIISLLKETALISTIGGMDLMRRSQALAAEHYTYFIPLCIVGLYYYGLVMLIEYASKKIRLRY